MILQMGKHKITLLVSSVLPYARKDEAKGMYEIIEDEIVERPIANPS